MVALLDKSPLPLKTALRARGATSSFHSRRATAVKSSNCIELGVFAYDACRRLGSCSNDRNGRFRVGANLFNYVESSPTRRVDPTDLEPIQPDPKRCYGCCCCPVSVKVSGFGANPTLGQTWYTQAFVTWTITVKFFRIKSPANFSTGDNLCSLEFWELPFDTIPGSTPPITGGYIPDRYTPGVWNDAGREDTYRDSEFFDPWENFVHPPFAIDPKTGVRMTDCEKKGRPQSISLDLTDHPASGNSRGSSFLYFYSFLRITGGAKCNCKPPKAGGLFLGMLNALGWQEPPTSKSPRKPPVSLP